jgi:hypothetical protein
MMAPDPRRWWETREGTGDPWTVGPGPQGPWAGWDDEFKTQREVVEWTASDGSATVVMRETNDYFLLFERGWVTSEITYYFDDADLISGLLIRSRGERPPGRTAEFVEWARATHPEELDELMPDGEIDPTGDHPTRFRALLLEWREETGVGPITD